MCLSPTWRLLRRQRHWLLLKAAAPSVSLGAVLGATSVQAAVSPPSSAQTSGHQEQVATTTYRVFLAPLLTSLVQMSLATFWQLSGNLLATSGNFWQFSSNFLATFWQLSGNFLTTLWQLSGDFLATFWQLLDH